MKVWLIFFRMCDCFRHTLFAWNHMWYIYVQWFRPIDYFVVIVWIFVYMYMKYLLSPLCNKKCYIIYNIVHNMKITTHILPMFLRAIKWKCSLLTFDCHHTVKDHEGKFQAGFIKSCSKVTFCSSYQYMEQNIDDHICQWGNLSHKH